eukprot:jgi/Ulvmu1/10664/UM066_0048.1
MQADSIGKGCVAEAATPTPGRCNAAVALMHVALTRGSQACLLLLLLATLAIAAHTYLRQRPPACILAMHDVTVATTAAAAAVLNLSLLCCGVHAAPAGQVVCLLTLLSALDFLPEHARTRAWRTVHDSLRTEEPASRETNSVPESGPRLPSPTTTSSLSLSSPSEESYPSRSPSPPSPAAPIPAQHTVPLGCSEPAMSSKPLWPMRHSIDGCLLTPQPRHPSHTQLAALPEAMQQGAAAPVAAAMRPPRPPAFPGNAYSLIGVHVPVCGYGSRHEALPPLPPRRWSVDNPVVLSTSLKPLHWLPPMWAAVEVAVDGHRSDVPPAEYSGSMPPAGGWYEALAANALVLDSLEPLNPRCAAADTKLRGIGLHACNPLMHELQRQPSSTTADALKRFGLPRRDTAWGSSVATGLAPHAGRTGARCDHDMGGWLQGASHISLGGAACVQAPAGACGYMHGAHACVRIIAGACIAVLWQGTAALYWATAMWAREDPAQHDGTGAPTAAAHSVHGLPGAPELAGCGLTGHRAPTGSHALFAFFLFLKVHAAGWVRPVQLAWHATAVALSGARLVWAARSLRKILRLHAAHASPPHTHSAPCRPLFRGAHAPSGTLREPLLSLPERGDPSSFTAQQAGTTAQGAAQGIPVLWTARRHACRPNRPVPRVSLAGPRAEAGVCGHSATVADGWPRHTPSIELLQGSRPQAHAYSTLLLPRSPTLDMLSPTATPPLMQPDCTFSLGMHRPLSSMVLPAPHSTQHMSECGDGERGASAMLPAHALTPRMESRSPGWTRHGEGGYVLSVEAFLAQSCLVAYCVVCCVNVWAFNRVVAWNQVVP